MDWNLIIIVIIVALVIEGILSTIRYCKDRKYRAFETIRTYEEYVKNNKK